MTLEKVILYLGFLLALSSPAVAETIYTANEKDHSISVISWPTRNDDFSVPVPVMPHNIDISAQAGYILVTGMPHKLHAEAVGYLLVFDHAKIKEGAVASIEVGLHPAHVVADAKGQKAYVTLSGENAVAVVDLSSFQVVKKIPVGKYPHGLRFSADGLSIYVANMGEDTISIIDSVKEAEAEKIVVGSKPVQVAVTPDGSLLYASLNDENKISVVDIPHKKLMSGINVGHGPVQSIAAQGKLFVANQGSRSKPDREVSVIDTRSQKVTATIKAGNGPHGVAVSKDGSTIFVTNLYDGTLTVIAADSLEVLGSIPTGAEPNGIATADWD